MRILPGILLAVLLLFLLLLFTPLRLRLEYLEKRLTVTLRWLFLRRELLGALPAKKVEEAAAEVAEEAPEKLAKKLDISACWALARELLPRALPITRRLLRRIVLRDIYVGWLLARPDAAATAIACGRAYACLHAALATLATFFTLRPWELDIRPEYSGRQHDEVAAEAEVRLIPAAFLAAAALLALQFCLSYRRIKPKTLFREEVPNGT